MIRALLVDDEQHCLDTLAHDLAMVCKEHVQIVGTATNFLEATGLINSKQPDLIFLDIELPGMNGLQFLETIELNHALVVFTTAHSKYALEGYRLNAQGYLLKPIDTDELLETVLRLKDLISIKKTNTLSKKLSLPDAQGVEFIDFDSIIWCESDNNYSRIMLVDDPPKLVSKTLKYIESKLPPDQFVRIHHSRLVNLGHVRKYLNADGGQVLMSDDKILNVSKSFKQRFLALFK